MDADRRAWNDEHARLRRLLEKERDLEQAVPLFLSHHATVHTTKLVPGKHWSFQDQVLDGLTAEQMRHIPKGGTHSIVWMIWHITRIEDVTMNLLLADSPQVLERGKWLGKLASPFVDVGNEMSAQEIAQLSQAVNVKALLAYRLAVGKRTRQIARRLNPNELWQPPAPGRVKRIAREGAVRDAALGLLRYWGGHASANLLLMPASRHGLVHLNEARCMLPKLRQIE